MMILGGSSPALWSSFAEAKHPRALSTISECRPDGYCCRVTSPSEQPSTPGVATIVVSVVAIVLGFLVLKAVVGFVFTVAKLIVVALIVVGVVLVLTRSTPNTK